ncbi:MAG: hypothetical protein ABI834_09595 [Ginsengibacter sp.]
MDTLTKNKSLISIIIFLLITNVAMLIFFLVLGNPAQRNSHGHDQNGISDLLEKEVGFTKEQIDTYQSLRKEHFEKVHPLFNELRTAKENLFNLIYSAQVSDSSVNMAADLIAEKQKILDLQMFNHFKKLRNICTPDQLQKFDSTIKKVITRMTGKPGKEVHNH